MHRVDENEHDFQRRPPPSHTASGRSRRAEATLRWAALAESGSTPPLARAILDAAPPIRLPEETRFLAEPGRGIRAFVAGHAVTVGKPRIIGGRIDRATNASLARLRDAGKMAVLVAVDEDVVGVIGIADVPRANAAEAI